jgi:ABC-2 type transport system permease protein
MIGPLGYLAARSTRNRLVRQLRRLRTPRYALALLLGLAYLWYVGIRQRPGSGPTGVSPETVELLAAAGVTAVLLWTWTFGADRRALAFSRAEVTWLFPAPVTRRQLIQYKLLRGQLVILFNVLLWTFLLSRGWAGTGPWRRAAAIWILLTTLALHRLGVALLRSSLLEHGRAAIRARAVTLTLLGIVATAMLVDVIQAAPALGAAWDLGLKEFLAAAHNVAVRPVPAALLLPGRLLVRPMLAPSWAEWGRAMLPATVILVAHYVWVVRSDAAFEESAAAAALARHRAGPRPGRAPRFTARPIPRLAPAGWPAGALLWKNLASVVRTGRARGILLGFAAAALAVAVLSAGEGSTTLLEIVGWLAAMWAGFLLVLGPQWVRNDLRTDLSRLALLRSYPLRGETVVGAETAGSTAVLTALQLGLIGIAYLAFWGGDVREPAPELRTAALAAAVLFLPAINFLAMLIQNGAALLLPAWVRVGSDRPIGVEALGHNMLVMSGFVVILAGLLLAPAVVAGLVFVGLEPMSGRWAVAPAAASALVVAALEARLLLARLGRVFEATDPSAVPPAESG